MATVDTSRLQLRTDHRKKEGRLQYDPHLQEEKSRAGASPRWIDVIARLKDPSRAGELFQDVRNPGKGQIVTGRAPVQEIEEIRGNENVISLKAAQELHLCLYNSVPAIRADLESLDRNAQSPRGNTFPGLDGSGIVIGIVDTGCDFRHRNFRQGKATRIRWIWDQSAEAASPPAGFGYGREISAEGINDALRWGDEEAYRILGYTPPIGAHGTHVMDIAAGNGREPALFGGRQEIAAVSTSHPGVAPNATLVFVQLKTFEGGSLGNSRQLLDAVEYIFERADQLNMPAVVNLSLSASGGPHDGSTLVEQGFEALLKEKPGRAIVVAAGNAYRKQSHTSGTVRRGETATIRWHTDPRLEQAKNEMEIWYPGDRELKVTLRAPGGKGGLGPVELRETRDLHERGSRTRLGRVSHRAADPNNGDHQIVIQLPHLENVSGPWEIELSSETDDVPFHAWIEQNDHGLSRFEDADTHFTLGSISCGESTIAVGAFDTSEQACLMPPFEATPAGPTRPGVSMRSRQKPEISAPGAGIVAARAHGGVTLMSGTSMAAAHVTGVVALLFQLAQRAGLPRLSIQETREILIQSAQPRDGEPLSHRLGAGSVDGAAAVRRLLETKAPRTAGVREGALDGPYTQDILRILAAQLSQTSQVLDRLIQN